MMRNRVLLLCALAVLLGALPRSTQAEPLEIAFLTEEFSFSEKYQAAVAEMLREHFSDQLKVVPSEETELCLYITGTNVEDGSEVQRIDISIRAYVRYPIGDSRQKRFLPAALVLSELSGLFGSPSSERAEDVKQVAQRVITEFLGDWNKAEEVEGKSYQSRART